MSDEDFDRSEDATPYKLEKAKEKGQVAKSTDAVSVLVFIVALVMLYWRGLDGMRELFRFDLALIAKMGQTDSSFASNWYLLSNMLKGGIFMLLPFFFAIMLTAIVSNLVQTGAILSTHPITPDFTKLNPANGIKKFFSMRSLFDAGRICLKLLLLGLVVYIALKGLTSQFFHIAAYSPAEALKLLLDDVVSLGFKMALMLFLLAAVDLIYTRREFAKKMRMSKRDIKDEMKNRDGDPRIRSRLRELRKEMLKRSQSAAKTKDADVLITNPTHIAVALRYEHGKMDSPQLLAKGAGSLAAAMRKIAARHQIPVVQNRSLARKLFHEVDVEHHVPQHLYADVARILIWVMAMRKARQERMARPA
ncbi:EscU/YscU/HrcU family type III secretion system export apparatus switch protein [Undibacterium flavidum]|uniref:EscU/YscU/HrcU family type III secretion system export apparatus switch protein n=1 Tax=Undibacterium flavidum TaxID=2762297 RepID=A0ABR6YES5_9BURK|nr:EscU/YscU/HrcU family type III secretion system export apparatus switch protein [Undibacterium flavidum]MBC3875071.1 EscU/YscU/HrcU family type III secretion system export apparatus switch protein [Undibacterium flavidum]